MYSYKLLHAPCDSPDYGCIAINPSGSKLAVVSTWKFKVYLYDLTQQDNALCGTYGTDKPNHGTAGFYFSGTNNGITFGPNDNVLICDACNHRVMEITSDCAFVREIDIPDREPVRIACSDTCIAVTSTAHMRYFMSSIFLIAYDSAQLLRRIDVNISPALRVQSYYSGVRFVEGDLMFVDYHNSAILRVPTQNLLSDADMNVETWTDPSFHRPLDVCVHESLLYVANGYGHNVLIFNASKILLTTMQFDNSITYPYCLASHPTQGVFVKESRCGSVMIVHDNWHESYKKIWMTIVT